MKHPNRFVGLILTIIFFSLFTFSWILTRKSILGIGHGLSIDGLRNYFLLVIVLVLFVVSTANKKFRLSKEIAVFLGFSLYAVSTTLFAQSYTYALRDSMKLIYPIMLYFLVRSLLTTREKNIKLFKGIISIIGFLVLITAAFAIFAYFNNWYTIQEGPLQILRITDLPNTYSLSIGVVSIYCILVSAIFVHMEWRIVHLLPITLLSIFIVLITVTRSYVVGMLLALLATLWTKTRTSYVKMLFGVIGFYTALVSIVTLVPVVKQRMFWTPEDFTFFGVLVNPFILFNDQFVINSGRVSIWNYIISRLHSLGTPIFGGGIGGARYVLQGGDIFTRTAVAHGDYAKYLAETGYIGLIFFGFALLFVMTRCYVNVYKVSDPVQRTLNASLFGIMVYFVVVGYGYEIFGDGFEFMAIVYVLFAIRDNIDSLNSHSSHFNKESTTHGTKSLSK